MTQDLNLFGIRFEKFFKNLNWQIQKKQLSNMKELKNISTLPPKEATKKECKKALSEYHQKLFKLQNVFYADGRYGLLVILQGIDTSGKDGTIRHVMACMNPMGIHVKSFKAPTDEERKHDFLWRVYPHIPKRSMLQVFNRSYYEDIIVPTINQSVSEKTLKHRYTLINELEHHLILNDIHVLKFFLHISSDKQKERIEERLTKPHKRWKYSKEDEKSAMEWDIFIDIYNELVNKCDDPKWHIIPSDKRWYRNYSVAKVLTEYLEKLDLKYPGIEERP